jgi:hypothetical protein
MRCGMPLCSLRTAIDCWRAKWAKDFLAFVAEQARGQGWASDEHFNGRREFAGTLASVKSFQSNNKNNSFRRMIPQIPQWISPTFSATAMTC